MDCRILCLLLALLLLAGCAVSPAASAAPTASTVPVSRNPETTAAPETVPAPETEPETAPPETTQADAGLAGTVMELSPDLTASPEAPAPELVIRFPETDLTGAPEGRSCTLMVYRDGSLVRAFCSFLLVPGAECRLEVPFTFTRYMADTAELTVTLHYGSESLTETAAVKLENEPDEVWAARTGDPLPYSIDILRNHNVVVVYGKDAAGDYAVPVKVFVCSTGRATPWGNYRVGDKFVWGALFGNVYGQYVSRITGNILFHSVPYYSMQKNRLETEEYNKLGTAASMGCIQLPVRDCKWIFDNCPFGTAVHIYDVEELPVEKPEPIHLDPSDPRSGWDPTDPDPANPWLEVSEAETEPTETEELP